MRWWRRNGKAVSEPPTLEQVPDLVRQLVRDDDSGHCLHQLHTLSEEGHNVRKQMVRLVTPALLDWIERYPPSAKNASDESILQQPHFYVALLILNNLSIPIDNKRIIGLEYDGVHRLACGLCKDPSCHLIAIVLVNLTFVDSSIRGIIANRELVLALAFATRVGNSPTLANKNIQGTPIECWSQSCQFDDDEDKEPIYPDTVRWCLCALQNLTRPGPNACDILADYGVVPFVLKMVQIPDSVDTSYSSSSTQGSPTPIDPDRATIDPSQWGPHSAQDPAMFILLNLAVAKQLHHADHLLERIADYPGIQGLKARMALSYRQSECSLPRTQAEELVELLSNTLHNQAKEHHYVSGAFALKSVLLSIRKLLNSPENQVLLSGMDDLNGLLLKVVARHVLLDAYDKEAAEYAVFSLYLLSQYGFRAPFLPGTLARGGSTRDVAAKVLARLMQLDCTTAAASHASHQLMLRLQHLYLKRELHKVNSKSGYCFERKLMEILDGMEVPEYKDGAVPLPEIFSRSILRKRPNDFEDAKEFPSALHAVYDISYGSPRVRHLNGIDDIQIANNIVKCANGVKSETYGFVWRWQNDVVEEDFTEARCRPMSLIGLKLTLPNICGSDTTTNE